MKSILRRAGLFAVLVSLVFTPGHAEEAQPAAAPSQGAEDGNSYLPPSARNTQKKPASSSTTPAEPRATGGTSAAHATQPAPNAQKTIGVISTIGETFTVKTVGVTAFGNEENKFPIAAWKVDDRVTAEVGALLKKTFKVKRIPAPPGAFAALNAPGRLLRNYDEDHTTVVRKLAEKQRCDYYLVIGAGGSQFGSSNQTMEGLGVTRTSGGAFGIGGGDYVHALTSIRVYDSEFKLVRNKAGSLGEETFMATVKGPHQLLEDEGQRLPPEPQAAFGDPRAKQITLELLDKSLAMTLPKLFAQE